MATLATLESTFTSTSQFFILSPSRAGELIHYSCFASVTMSAWPCPCPCSSPSPCRTPCPCAQNLCVLHPVCLQPLCPVSQRLQSPPVHHPCARFAFVLPSAPMPVRARARARLFVRFSLLPSVSLPVVEELEEEQPGQPQPSVSFRMMTLFLADAVSSQRILTLLLASFNL